MIKSASSIVVVISLLTATFCMAASAWAPDTVAIRLIGTACYLGIVTIGIQLIERRK